jgi:transcriptional regulator with XRE-family HTH domain
VPKIGYYYAVSAEITRLLQIERKRRRLSKYAVSQRSGVSQSMLSLVERGFRNPSIETMLRIADGVGVDLSKLIKQARRTVSKNEQ